MPMLGLLEQLAALDRAQIAEIVKEAMARDGYPDADPNIEIVDRNHWLFQDAMARKRAAMAARDPDGGEWVLINKDAPDVGDTNEEVLGHEAGHLTAWRRHGEKIEEHGREFRQACKKIVNKRPGHYCGRNY